MMLKTTTCVVASCVVLCVALSVTLSAVTLPEIQAAASSSVRGVADEYYGETYRPQFHFSPMQHWMNDPNGMVYYNGEYHLFYQFNPYGNVWGHMSWGHAVSRDLVHWRHLPVALYEENNIMIFSGSAVVDSHNSSGLGGLTSRSGKASPLIAIYTGHSEGKQTQNIAASQDQGRTWTKYAGNPVIDINQADFRDPKVIWHKASQKWVMVTALPKEKKLRFYGSKDLKKWNQLSDFGPAGATDGIWECPDLFQLTVDGNPRDKKWVLIVNLNPGAVAGGSGGQYFIGEFDGETFRSDELPQSQPLWADYGKDFYAAVSWSDVPVRDGRRLWLGWMNNWEYANKVPTHPWRGQQSIPRLVTLKRYAEGIRLVQQPVAELQSLRDKHQRFANKQILPDGLSSSALASLLAAGDALEIKAEFQLGTAAEFGFKVRRGGDGDGGRGDAAEETLVGYNVKDQQLFVDRKRSGNVGFDSKFPGKHTGPLRPATGGRVRLHIFVDRSSVEAFGGDGQIVITDLIYPRPSSRGLQVYSSGGAVKLISLDVWNLKSAWKKTPA